MRQYRLDIAIIILCFLVKDSISQNKRFTDRYQFTIYGQLKTWDDAIRDCSARGSKLVQLDNNEKKAAVADLVYGRRKGFWIAATDNDYEDIWKWHDGSNVYSADWARNEPNNYGWGEDCAVIMSSSKWNDVHCTRYKAGYICQKSFSHKVEVKGHGKTYKFYRKDAEIADFFSAQKKCRRMKTRLAEARTVETRQLITSNAYIYFTTALEKKQYYWIGGSKIQQEKWLWNNRTDIASDGWAPGQPSVSSSKCTASSTTGWVARPCTDKLPFICETEVVNNIQIKPSNATLYPTVGSVMCTADGFPTPTLYWLKDQIDIPYRDEYSTVFQSRMQGEAKSTLHVENSSINDEGLYTCRAENDPGDEIQRKMAIVTLLVPSFPVINSTIPSPCNSSLVITWTPNKRATNISHRIKVTRDWTLLQTIDISNVKSRISQVVGNLSDTTEYRISISPCPKACKLEYTAETTGRTGGLPRKVQNAIVDTLSALSCNISWTSPLFAMNTPIRSHKIYIKEEVLTQPGSSSWFNTTGSENNWILHANPNRKYQIGIQAQTCAGDGPMVFANGSCVTEKRAPAFVPKSQVNEAMGKNGTADIRIIIPSQENGPLSCVFVMVKVQSQETTMKREMTLFDLQAMQINASRDSNGSKPYIAMAITVPRLTSSDFDLTLGKGNNTTCNLFARNLTREKRSTNNKEDEILTGKNKKLNPYKSYEVFTVSTTPNKNEIYIRRSEPTILTGLKSEGENGNEEQGAEDGDPPTQPGMAPIVGGVVGGLLIIIVAAILIWKRKRFKGVEVASAEETGEDDRIPGEPVTYENMIVAPDTGKRSDTDIVLSELEDTYNHMLRNDFTLFIDEFQRLVQEAAVNGGTKNIASDLNLKRKNRYKNILPFDDTRVVIENNDTGYINACYVDGFRQKRRFIATQGPLPTTVDDFWIMVAEQKSTKIVMLSRCYEAGKRKCEKYWPDLRTSKTFGPVEVINREEIKRCGFVIRTFSVHAILQGRRIDLTVSQYHFRKWPDHGVPLTTSHLIYMHREAMVNRDRSPIIVHCSAGAGRTGAFIGYDIVLHESKKLGRADPYTCVLTMRKQRVDMVQNCDQYMLMYKLLLESHLFDDTDLTTAEALDKFNDDNYRRETAVEQFENIGRVECSQMLPKVNASSPGGIMTKTTTHVESNDDAVGMIVTEGPTKDAVESFWNEILTHNVPVIITLSSLREIQVWPERRNNSTRFGDVEITKINESETEYYTKRTLVVRGHRNNLEVTQFYVRDEKDNNTRAKVLITTVDMVHKALMGKEFLKVLIHGSDIGKVGSFCAAVNLIERLKIENRIDVFRTMKDLRDYKQNLVNDWKDYDLCHQVVIEYMQSFDVYANFR